jgi:hypothetical protein
LIAPVSADRDVARDVTASTKMLGAANFTSQYEIGWPAGTAGHGIPTPGFEGTLVLRAGQDYCECEIVLDGGYQAPGGLAGRLFDDVVGRRIAHATLGALLDGVRRELHGDHEQIEAEKRLSRTAL